MFIIHRSSLVHRERFELSQLNEATVLQTACLNRRRPMLGKIKNWCKIKKAEILDRRRHTCASRCCRLFSFGTRQSFNEEDNLSKLSAFFYFCPGNFLFRRIFAHKKQNSRTFSVIQLSNIVKNEKERRLLSLFRELSRHRS